MFKGLRLNSGIKRGLQPSVSLSPRDESLVVRSILVFLAPQYMYLSVFPCDKDLTEPTRSNLYRHAYKSNLHMPIPNVESTKERTTYQFINNQVATFARYRCVLLFFSSYIHYQFSHLSSVLIIFPTEKSILIIFESLLWCL